MDSRLADLAAPEFQVLEERGLDNERIRAIAHAFSGLLHRLEDGDYLRLQRMQLRHWSHVESPSLHESPRTDLMLVFARSTHGRRLSEVNHGLCFAFEIPDTPGTRSVLNQLWWRCYEDHRIQREQYAMREAVRHIELYSGDRLTRDEIGDIADLHRRRQAHIDRITALQEMFNEMLGRLLSGMSPCPVVPGDPEAKQRGEALLKAHLSTQQLEDYERDKRFTVRGSAGGRYRINHGRQMNIDVLNWRGVRKHGICFLPIGGLVAGDCMLAQKITLETDEPGALKIANRFH